MNLIHFPLTKTQGFGCDPERGLLNGRQCRELTDIYKLVLQNVYGQRGYVGMLQELEQNINRNVFLKHLPEVTRYMQNYVHKTIRLNVIISRFVGRLRGRVVRGRIARGVFQNEHLLDFDTPVGEVAVPLYISSPAGEGINVWVFSKEEVLSLLANALETHDSWTATPRYITNPYTNRQLTFAGSWVLMRQLEQVVTVRDVARHELYGLFLQSQYDTSQLIQKHTNSMFRVVVNRHLHSLEADDLYEIFYDAVFNSTFQNMRVFNPLPDALVARYRGAMDPDGPTWRALYNDHHSKASLIVILSMFFANNSRPSGVWYNQQDINLTGDPFMCLNETARGINEFTDSVEFNTPVLTGGSLCGGRTRRVTGRRVTGRRVTGRRVAGRRRFRGSRRCVEREISGNRGNEASSPSGGAWTSELHHTLRSHITNSLRQLERVTRSTTVHVEVSVEGVSEDWNDDHIPASERLRPHPVGAPSVFQDVTEIMRQIIDIHTQDGVTRLPDWLEAEAEAEAESDSSTDSDNETLAEDTDE